MLTDLLNAVVDVACASVEGRKEGEGERETDRGESHQIPYDIHSRALPFGRSAFSHNIGF